MKVTVKPDSAIVKKRIDELDLAARMGVDILAIRRNSDWILNPRRKREYSKGYTDYSRSSIRH